MFAAMRKLFVSSARPVRKAVKPCLRLEKLEDRRVMAAGITLGADAVIRIEGFDNAAKGETVQVRLLLNNAANPYDDQINVGMTSALGNAAKTFSVWKNVSNQHTRLVNEVNYRGHAGADRFNNISNLPSFADGGAGNDVLQGGVGRDELHGGIGSDTLTGRLGDDILDGGADIDTLTESGDADFTLRNTSLQGLGWDALIGIEKADLTGGASANTMDAMFFSGSVIMHGGAGNDFLFGGSGKNWIYGDAGNDFLFGSADVDRLFGGDGDDNLLGQGGDDYLFGDKGRDTLSGGDGNDYLDGGYDRVKDLLHGGAGQDIFENHLWHDTSSYLIWLWTTHGDSIEDAGPEDTVHTIHN